MDAKKGSQSIEDDKICYCIVGKIPAEFHSADVRAFFSQFVEEKGFLCFHYRHRPEVQKDEKQNDSLKNTKQQNTCCCIIIIYKDKMDEFIKMYNGQNWVDKAGKLFKENVLISRIRMNDSSSNYIENPYKTKQEKIHNIRTNEEFIKSDLYKLPELNPPSIMPNGNVGTPLCIFIELIRTCKFPPHLIKKLGLTFPRSKKRKYGNVPFDYSCENGSEEEQHDDDERVDDFHHSVGDNTTSELSKTGEAYWILSSDKEKCDESQSKDEIINRKLKNSAYNSNKSSSTLEDQAESTFPTSDCLCQRTEDFQNSQRDKSFKCSQCSTRRSNCEFNEDKLHMDKNNRYEDDNSEGELEEWDRHEALHDDVTSQGRTKERLYENHIELKWEKGGSGLVWYTDAAFWKQREEADFDEETADDWDVDMSIYEDEGAGDMDARTLLQLRVEEQRRQGKDIDINRVGSFEKYTRGIGGQVMRKQGWRIGQSLGSSQVGITEPISSIGQKPKSKRGLGYYGEKLNRLPKKARPTREAVISTVYDKKEERSAELFQSQGPFTIKYRDNVEFVPETETTH